MIKQIYKTTLLSIIISCSVLLAKAQRGYDFSQYDVGASFGMTSFTGEAAPYSTKPSVNLNITYNQTPFTNFVFEVQLGQFAAGDSTQNSGLQFKSSFSAFIFRAQLQLGEILDYSRSPFANAMKNFYVSAGAGFLVNRVSVISKPEITGLTYNAQNKTQEPFIPLRLGYEFKLFNKYQQPSFKVDVGYEYNYILSDASDGYNFGGRKDTYTSFFLGFKFAIGGGIVSCRKQIVY